MRNLAYSATIVFVNVAPAMRAGVALTEAGDFVRAVQRGLAHGLSDGGKVVADLNACMQTFTVRCVDLDARQCSSIASHAPHSMPRAMAAIMA